MKNKFKTSTRISIIFSFFTFIIIFLLLIVLNIYLFISWYGKEIKELKESNIVTNVINSGYKEIISDEIKDDESDFLEWLLELDLFEEAEDDLKWYEDLFLNIYSKNKKIFLIYKKESGKFYAPYEVTEYYNNQKKIIKIGLILLIIFTLLSYIISKKLFIRFALKDVFYISKKLKNIDLNNIKKIHIDLDKNDEINSIVDWINSFLWIIQKNHSSLQQFNSQVAHEFKTPLMVISSELEFLWLSWDENESMKRIEFQIQKLDSLLEHFLLLTKIQNWKTLKKQNINLYDICKNISENLQEIYKEKNINIENTISKKIEITTNSEFFEIIIKNMLDNAYKYNKTWWDIILSTESQAWDSALTLKIKDNWIGIKKENIEKIWDNLYRENNFWSGYWVGLNLVKKISDVLWYKIIVKSSEGEWSEFRIIL